MAFPQTTRPTRLFFYQDMIMPGMGGGEVVDRPRAPDPHVKILFTGGDCREGGARAILQRGGSGFVRMPFDLSGCPHKIRKILNPRDACGFEDAV